MLLFRLPTAMHHEFLCSDLCWCLLFQSLRWIQDHINSLHSRRCQLWQTMGLILHHLHQDLETLVVPSQEVPAFLLQMGLLGTPRKRPWLINHAICSSFSFFLWHCPCGCGFLCRLLLAVFVLNGEEASLGPGGTWMKIAVASLHQFLVKLLVWFCYQQILCMKKPPPNSGSILQGKGLKAVVRDRGGKVHDPDGLVATTQL